MIQTPKAGIAARKPALGTTTGSALIERAAPARRAVRRQASVRRQAEDRSECGVGDGRRVGLNPEMSWVAWQLLGAVSRFAGGIAHSRQVLIGP
jgi:hypothetical protein